MIWQIILQIVLIAVNAVFACAEASVITINDAKLEKLSASGNKKAVRLKKLISQPTRFLATIQVAITLSGFIGAAFAADNFGEALANAISKTGVGIPYNILKPVSVVAITLLLSYITLVFGELVPKRLAMKNPEKVAIGLSGTVSFVAIAFRPLVWFLTVCTNGVLRLLHVDPNETGEEVSEEEIRMMVDAGAEKGVIDEEEQEMIKNVFEFDNLSVEEFATHRTDMVILWMEDDLETWKECIHETRHSVYPVCGESADDLVGVLNAKDFFRLWGASREEILAQAMSPAYLVPEGIKADTLFRQMKATRNRFAVVMDEHGGVSGIVTMNDLIEQIVGGFEAESIEEEAGEIVALGDDRWRIKGSAPLDDVKEELHIDLGDDEEYDTFGGLVFGKWGTIPADGTTFSVALTPYVQVEVQEIKEHRIETAFVTVTRPAEEEIEEEAQA